MHSKKKRILGEKKCDRWFEKLLNLLKKKQSNTVSLQLSTCIGKEVN